MQSSPERFDGQTVIVTGSTRGIGKAVAERFAAEGATVVVTGRSSEDGAETVETIRDEGGTAMFVQADLMDTANIQALVTETHESFGTIDVLVNNASVQAATSVAEADETDWTRIIQTNFRSYWLCAKRAIEHMEQGSILNISSNHSRATMPAHFPYNAVKAGINGMTRAMALDFGPAVRVNTISPGWIAVERTTSDMSATERRELADIHPVGRLGRPADVAGVAAFLTSDDAAFVTGANVTVDGGRSAVLQDDVLPDYRSKR